MYNVTNAKCEKLSRVVLYMGISKKHVLLNAFFLSQFRYCPLVWMCHYYIKNKKINHLHCKCLWLIYNDEQSSFHELLERLFQQNLNFLVIGMFKIMKWTAATLVREVFPVNEESSH